MLSRAPKPGSTLNQCLADSTQEIIQAPDSLCFRAVGMKCGDSYGVFNVH